VEEASAPPAVAPAKPRSRLSIFSRSTPAATAATGGGASTSTAVVRGAGSGVVVAGGEEEASLSAAAAAAEEEEAAFAAEEGAGGGSPSSDEDDEEFDEFDPYLFMANLPPLESVVPLGERTVILPRKTRRSPPNTLVLDLDETLVHSTLEDATGSDFTFPVLFNNQEHRVSVRRRPHLQAFMEAVAAKFEVVVFTASQRVYAERLLNILDPERKHIRHRVFRDSCVYVEGNYLKDLSVLGRDLARTTIVDNSPQAFGFQLANGIPIESWFDDRNDTELVSLLPFLEKLANVDDVRPLIAQRFRLHDKVHKAQRRAERWRLLHDPTSPTL